MTPPRIKILVACHKADPAIRQDDIYMPIQVGKDLHPDLDLGFQPDNTGDNISAKNGSYCELTALYWAWKNLKDVDYIGLCHYRRYFAKNLPLISRIDITGPICEEELIGVDTIASIRPGEVILPKFWTLPQPNIKAFGNRVMEEDLYILYKVISKLYSDYTSTFSKYMLGFHKTGYNMFIMRKDDFNHYCNWLFSVLDETQKLVKPTGYVSYNRIYGYFGEILTAVYCLHNLKIKQNTILFVDPKSKKQSLLAMKSCIINLAHTVSYWSGLYWLKKKS